MKAELGYYVKSNPFFDDETFSDDEATIKVPIYGLRAVPQEIIDRQWENPNFGKRFWQVEIWYNPTAEYVWINQYRHFVFLH